MHIGKKHIGKKAVHIWLSWVLLMAFIVAMSAVMYNWIFGFTTSSTAEIERRVYDADECSYISLSIDDVCQTTTSLYMTVTNRNTLKIDKVIIKAFNTYGEPQAPANERLMVLEPSKTDRIIVEKEGVVSHVEIVPVTFKEKDEIVCTARTAVMANATKVLADC